MKAIGALFGANQGPQGPSAAEKAAQQDRVQEANRANAEADQKVALAARATTLRKSLAYRDDNKKSTLGG